MAERLLLNTIVRLSLISLRLEAVLARFGHEMKEIQMIDSLVTIETVAHG